MTQYGALCLQRHFLAVPKGVTVSGQACIAICSVPSLNQLASGQNGHFMLMEDLVPTDLAPCAVVRAKVVGRRFLGEEADGRFVICRSFAAGHGHEKPVLDQRPSVVIPGISDGHPSVLEVFGREIRNPDIVSSCGVRHDSVKVGALHMETKTRLLGDEASVRLRLPVSVG